MDENINYQSLGLKAKELSGEIAAVRKEENDFDPQTINYEQINNFLTMRIAQKDLDEPIFSLISFEETASLLFDENSDKSEVGELEAHSIHQHMEKDQMKK